MFSKAIPNLKTYLKKDPTATRYFVQGKGEIKLARSDFKAQGGEGAIYVKGSTAYKIYLDSTRAISVQKIRELSVLSQPNIIRPLDLLLSGKNIPIGYSMKSVGKSYSLCQLFPRAFRQRNNLTSDLTLKLVRRLQEGVAHVHSKGILIVDLNELNFLISTDFREVFFIDVDSYQTPSFPAWVLMESVRDRHSKMFTTDTDWFSFAVVSFQMFTGIHPFKGTFPPLQHLPDAESKLNARMLTNISVLHTGVTVPMSCLSFSLIPPVYLDWYRAVFEEGKRLPPPQDVHQQIIVQPAIPTHNVITGSSFVITRLREFDSQIFFHDGSITITEKRIYFDGKTYPRPTHDLKLVVSPRQRHLIAAFIDSSELQFLDLTTGKDIDADVKAEEIAVSGGQLFIKQAESIFAIDLIELPNRILVGIKPIANVMMRATQMFEGLAIQNLLGATYASILVHGGKAYQVRLPELDSHQIVDAKLERNVLVVVVVKNGRYDKLIYRFAKQFDAYDVRVIPDIATTGIEFTVLDSGIVLHLAEDNLEVFSSVRGSTSIKTIADAALLDDIRLFHTGTQALIARGAEIYRIRLQV
jgi:serine/threonine protein kinase